MTRRRHPAQASRILAAGLSTATMLGVVAVLARPPAAEPPVVSRPVPTSVVAAPREAGAAPPKVAARRGGRATAGPQSRHAPVTTTGPS